MSERDDRAWVDKQGDVWRLGGDGLMHSFETAPFPREYVERKWGPLKPWSGVPAERPYETTLSDDTKPGDLG